MDGLLKLSLARENAFTPLILTLKQNEADWGWTQLGPLPPWPSGIFSRYWLGQPMPCSLNPQLSTFWNVSALSLYPFFPEQSASSFLFRRKVDDETIDPEKWLDLTKVITEGHDQAKKSMRSTLEFASLSSLQRLFWLMILAAGRQVQYPGWWEQGLQSLWALTPPLLPAFSSLQAQWLYFSPLRDGKCCSIPLWWFKSVMCLFLFPLYIQLSPFSGLLLHSFP